MSVIDLLAMQKKMVTIRLLEARLQKLCDDGLAGDLHFNKGQEAISVGVCAALRPSDRIVTHHRTIAHQIAKGAALRPLIAELLGRSTGTNGGRAGEMHISDQSIGHDFSFQLVATCIPVGAGLAWALKNYKRTNDVVVIFFGDAAASNGQFHEGMNMAAIHRLPILFVCENNGRAGNITPEHYAPSAAKWVGSRAISYYMPAFYVDGNDVTTVAKRVSDLLPDVRVGNPTFLECETQRLSWHKQGQRDVRTKEELERASMRDPLKTWPDGIDVEAIGSELDDLIANVLQDEPPSY